MLCKLAFEIIKNCGNDWDSLKSLWVTNNDSAKLLQNFKDFAYS